jgi:hypothetical protein
MKHETKHRKARLLHRTTPCEKTLFFQALGWMMAAAVLAPRWLACALHN